MHFDFDEDELLLQKTLRDFLAGALPVARVRELWDTETGRSREFWAQLAEIGVPGLLVPEQQGGLGMDETFLVLLLEETGRAALAEPVVATAAIAPPLLAGMAGLAGPGGDELAARWLPAIASGEAIVAVDHPVNAFLSDAHVADLLLLVDGGDIHALEPGAVALTPQPCNDPSRRLSTLDWTPSPATCVASGATAAPLLAAALDRGALACAAQQLGVTQALIDLAVRYATQRQQFGVPIGSFQAVKHMLADCAVKLEYARPLVYRAAHSVARGAQARSVDVSMAKVAASRAAEHTAKVALQVHGAIGYTWEQDVHVWMRRAWSLARAWGASRFHESRVGGALLGDSDEWGDSRDSRESGEVGRAPADSSASIGPARTFGYSPRA